MCCLHAMMTNVNITQFVKLACCSVCVSTGGIVNVMPLLFSQISHNKTQVNLVLCHILHCLLICRLQVLKS